MQIFSSNIAPLRIVGIIVACMIVFEIVMLLFLLQSVTSFKEYWDSRLQTNIQNNHIHYIALGDSAAQGVGASSPMRGYVGLISKKIEAKTGKQLKISNISKSGAGLQHVLDEQIPTLNRLAVDENTIITIAIGANDLPMHDEAWFGNKLDELLPKLPKQTIIADLPYFGSGIKRNLETKVRRFNTILRKKANTAGFTVAPLYETTKQRDAIGVHSFDLFHPSNIGYKNWAESFWVILEPKLY